MNSVVDWQWKLREAVERLKNNYENIGRKTGAPFLAIVYPVDAEIVVQKEWQAVQTVLHADFEIYTIDVLDITTRVLDDLGVENIVEGLEHPMPSSNPEAELGHIWIKAVTDKVHELATRSSPKKPILVLENLTSLYPAAGPHTLMQALWDHDRTPFEGPIVVFIPGTLIEPRVYKFLDQVKEFMYRGDIL